MPPPFNISERMSEIAEYHLKRVTMHPRTIQVLRQPVVIVPYVLVGLFVLAAVLLLFCQFRGKCICRSATVSSEAKHCVIENIENVELKALKSSVDIDHD
jgi:hypothetical protein